ncbi:hypothetical protein FB107DRAFT_223084 [Schizophyllum commune]
MDSAQGLSNDESPVQTSQVTSNNGAANSEDGTPIQATSTAAEATTPKTDNDVAGTAATDALPTNQADAAPPEQPAEPQRTEHQRSYPSPHHNHAEPSPLLGFPRYVAYGGPSRGGLEDYRETYPDDPYGAEAGENARVWRVYLEESGQLDEDMLRQFRDTLDVHLVFAALFSSVVTGFVVQTSQALQSDYGRISAALLMELVALQRAGSPDGVPSANVNLVSRSASAYDVAINSCFMVSLALSLATTLLAVLVKQWLVYYAAVPPGSARDRSLIHRLRYKALKKWKVSEIVGIVPSALNVSLVAFLIGLVLFAYDLHWYIFADILTITLATLVLYVYSHILPVLHWECPYRTPLAFLLRKWARHVVSEWKEIYSMSFDISLESYREIETALVSLTHDGRSHASDVIRLIHNTLRWLYFHAGNPTAKDVVLESMAGLSRAPWSRDDRQWILDMLDTLKERLQYRVVPGDKQSLLELERIMRALTTMYNSNMEHVDLPNFNSITVIGADDYFEAIHGIMENDIQNWISDIGDALLERRILTTYSIHAKSLRRYHHCIFSVGRETELPPSIWKGLLARSLITRPPFIIDEDGNFARDTPPCQHCFGDQHWSRGQLVELLLWFVRGLMSRAVIESGSPRYRPGEGPATLHKVCSWYADIRNDLVSLLCGLLDQQCHRECGCDERILTTDFDVDESALVATLLRLLIREGLPVPASLRQLATRNLRHAASRVEDVISNATPYCFARLDALSTLLSVLTDPRTHIVVSAEDLACMLSVKDPATLFDWQPSLHGLFSSLDNVLHLMECCSIRSPDAAGDDLAYRNLYRTLFDLFEQYGSLIRDMQAYSRELELDGCSPAYTSPKLLSDETVSCMIMLCSPAIHCVESAKAENVNYSTSLRELYIQTKDLSYWRHGFMTSILLILRVNAARRDPELDSLQLSRYRALRRFAEIVAAPEWTDDEGEYTPYVYCTAEYLKSLGVEALEKQDELVFGPYAVPFARIDDALPSVIPVASTESDV